MLSSVDLQTVVLYKLFFVGTNLQFSYKFETSNFSKYFWIFGKKIKFWRSL